MRRILSWKFVFYELLLPVLRGLGPARGDAISGLSGLAGDGVRPSRGTRLREALSVPARPSTRTGRSRQPGRRWRPTRRGSSRDYPLDRQTDEAVLSRFDVRGYERLRRHAVRRPRRDLGRQPSGSAYRGCSLAVSPRPPASIAGPAAPARLERAQSPVRRGGHSSAGRDVPAP